MSVLSSAPHCRAGNGARGWGQRELSVSFSSETPHRVWAPVLLVLCRLAQGLSAGAEYNGASTFIVERAPERRRGL